MDLLEYVGLLEAMRIAIDRDSGAENLREEFSEEARSPGTFILVCHSCGLRLRDDPVSFSVGRELFAKHLEEVHPEKKPRNIKSIREECDRRKRQEKERAAKERQTRERKARIASRGVRSAVLQSGKTNSGSKRNRKKIRQPSLTEEMVAEMRRLYTELGRIKLVCSACYKRFGFSSPYALRVVLLEHKIVLGISQNQRRAGDEIIEEIRRLYEEEGLSVREITERCHLSCGYSFSGFRNMVYEILIKNGLDPKKNTKRVEGSNSKMTPARIEVAWRLYSVGNYSVSEIKAISQESWGVSKNCLMNSLKRAGHKLRATKWDNDGSRPISEEEAIEMIKAVA